MISKKQPPKDGSLILAQFKNIPWLLTTMWNDPSQKWVVAVPQVEPFEGMWNDWYFENEFFHDHDLLAWQELPTKIEEVEPK